MLNLATAAGRKVTGVFDEGVELYSQALVLDTETFPANVGDATIAYCFLCGIKHGLFQTDCAKEWVFDVIAARDAPPIEIIEVAIAKTRDTVFCNLGLVCCGADNQLAGRWLLGTLVLNDNEA